MLAEYDAVFRHTDGFGRHYFVAKRIAENAVLMNTGLMGECVPADDRFIRLHAKANDRRQQLARRIKLRRVDIVVIRQFIGTDGHCHDQLFERCVTRTFADSVDRTFDLRRASLDSGETVRDRQAKIVVAMNADSNISVADNALLDRANEIRKFAGQRVSNGVGYVEHRRTTFDRGGEDLTKEIDIAASRIFGRKLDIIDAFACRSDRVCGHLDDFVSRLFQLVLQVNVRRRDKCMDT